MEKATLEELTGYLGVGAVEMLGAFLIGDGRSDLIKSLNELAAPQSLAIAGAVPLLVLCYVIGLVTATMVQAIVYMFKKPGLSADVFAFVCMSDMEMLKQKFAEVERHSRLLFGCSGAFLIVAVGCFLEVFQLGSNLAYIGYTCAAIGVVLALVCIPLGYKLQSDFGNWAATVESRSPHKEV